MDFVNLTTETISIIDYNGDIIKIEPSGLIAKVNIIETEINIKDYNVKFIQRKLERPIFPISIEEDIYYAKDIYIVSEDVLEALKEFYPSMGGRIFSPDNKINIIENLNGEVLFVTRLITF